MVNYNVCPRGNSSLIYDVLLNTLDVGRCLYLVSAMSTVSRHDCAVIFSTVKIYSLRAQLSRVFLSEALIYPYFACANRFGSGEAALYFFADSPRLRVVDLVIMASFVLSGSIPNLISDGT